MLVNITSIYDKAYFVIVFFLFYFRSWNLSSMQCEGTRKFLTLHCLKIQTPTLWRKVSVLRC